jgi:hypothetical protein
MKNPNGFRRRILAGIALMALSLPCVLPAKAQSVTGPAPHSFRNEFVVQGGAGMRSPGFDMLTGWTPDSLPVWFYGQTELVARLTNQLQADVSFLNGPVVFYRRPLFQADAGYARWLGPLLRASVHVAIGSSDVDGRLRMASYAFEAEDPVARELTAYLSAGISYTGFSAEGSYYWLPGEGLRPLLGVRLGVSQISWNDPSMEVEGVQFLLPGPEKMTAFTAGFHAGARWTLPGGRSGLEGRLFYMHFFSEEAAQVPGLALNVFFAL